MDGQKMKTFTWGAVTGAIALTVVLFTTGIAVSGSSAERQARMKANTAVAARLAEICIAQYEVDSDKIAKLAAMKDLSTWQRGNYVNQQGWATMPGSDSGASDVASECALRLAEMSG